MNHLRVVMPVMALRLGSPAWLDGLGLVWWIGAEAKTGAAPKWTWPVAVATIAAPGAIAAIPHVFILDIAFVCWVARVAGLVPARPMTAPETPARADPPKCSARQAAHWCRSTTRYENRNTPEIPNT